MGPNPSRGGEPPRIPVGRLLHDLGREIGLDVVVEPVWGRAARLDLGERGRRYVRGTVSDLNGAGATEIANDKEWAAYFLAQLGYPVPEGEAFLSWDWAERIGSDRTPAAATRYALELGLPVIVKPNG